MRPQMNYSPLFTLICYTASRARLEALFPLLRAISEQLPYKLILLSPDSSPPLAIPQCEDSSFLLEKNSEERILPWLLPRLVPSMPIFCLWGEPLTASSSLFNILVQLVDRFIVDISTPDCWQEHASHLVCLAEAVGKPDVVDLQWANLCGWRAALSQFFHTPDHLSSLQKSSHISLEHMPSGIIHALYLQGWIASLLGWQPVSTINKQGSLSLTYEKNDGNEITTELTTLKEENASAAQLYAIKVIIRAMTGKIVIAQKKQTLSFHIETEKECQLPIVLPLLNSHRGLYLLNELFYKATDSHYLKTLRLLTNFPQIRALL